MKLHLHDIAGQNTITGHGTGYVQINGARLTTPVLLTPEVLISPWPAPNFDALRFDDFAALLALKPSLVVFGSGPTFRFPESKILAAFSQARIGFEVMDTPAACRTYNVLLSEGRAVGAALYV
jgi:uncharacterized protein